MAQPQQRELARNEKVPSLAPDASETELSAQDDVKTGGRTGPVPSENLPGHHPDDEQDKPDGAAFLAKMQGKKAAGRKAATKKAAAAKDTGARNVTAQQTAKQTAKKAAAKSAPVAKKAAAPVKKAQPEPAPVPDALAGMPSGEARTTRTPEAAATPAASTASRGGIDVGDVRDVALKLVFWPVTVGVWAGKQVIRRVRGS